METDNIPELPTAPPGPTTRQAVHHIFREAGNQGLSDRNLCDKSGIKRGRLWKIKTYRSSPKLDEFVALCEATNITPTQIAEAFSPQ